MTLSEAQKRFTLPLYKLEEYVAFGFIRRTENRQEGEPEYREDDFYRLGLVGLLLSVGFTQAEVIHYLKLTEQTETKDEQIRMLRKRRRELLDSIHKQQQLLDNLDYLIVEKKNI